MESVSILGCGWLGLPLAKKMKEVGFQVKGSTTTKSKLDLLNNHEIDSHLISLPSKQLNHDFFRSDYLIINIPPKTSKEGVNHHLESIQSIINRIPADQKIIYVSATSVYPQVDHDINEDHPLDLESDRARALIQTEKLLQESFKGRLNILRLGGLLGYDRIPGKYYAGKKMEQHQQKANYIHRDDAVGLIIDILQKKQWGHIFNGVAPIHPTKKQIFTKNAEDFDFVKPDFKEGKQILTNRKILSTSIEQILDYSFIYPDPLHFFYTN